MRTPTFVVLFLVVLTPAVHGATKTPSDTLIDEGIDLRLKGDHKAALDRFERAHGLSPSARTLAQMGLAEASLHRWVEAEDHLTKALARHDTPWIENGTNRELLEKSLVVIRTHIGIVTVNGPPGTEVSIDGRPMGRLPFEAPLHVAEGKVRMEGTAQSRQSAGTDVAVPGGGYVTLNLELPAPIPAIVAPAPAPVSAPVMIPSNEPLHPTAAPAEGSSWQTWTGTGLLFLSAATLVTGIIWLAVDGSGNCTAPSGSRCERVYDTKTPGWIAVGVGVAAGATGGILLWQGRQHSEMRIGLGVATLKF